MAIGIGLAIAVLAIALGAGVAAAKITAGMGNALNTRVYGMHVVGPDGHGTGHTEGQSAA